MSEIQELRRELAETNERLDIVVEMLGALYRARLAELDRRSPAAGAADALLDFAETMHRLTRRKP